MKPFLFVLLCLVLLLPAAQPVQGAKAPVDENAPLTYWRVGFMLTTPPTPGNLANIPASAAVRLSSTVAPLDNYFVLPMSTLMQIQEVKLLVFDRSGAYAGSYIASVEVYSLSAGYLRTLTSAGLDLQTAANNTWVTLPLSSGRILQGDEVLVIHFQRSGSAEGNLSLGVGLEVTGQNLTVYLPSIMR